MSSIFRFICTQPITKKAFLRVGQREIRANIRCGTLKTNTENNGLHVEKKTYYVLPAWILVGKKSNLMPNK